MSIRKLQDKRKDTENPKGAALFPARQRFSYRFNGPDEMSSYGAQRKQNYFQMSPGKFEGILDMANTNPLQLSRET